MKRASASTSSRPTARRVRAIAVQPKWSVDDFLTPGRFRRWLDGQRELARPHLAPDRPNLLVLTELNGLPLLLRGAYLARRAPTLNAAIALVLLKHLPAAAYLAARERVSLVRGLMLALAPDTARTYLDAMRDLARETGAYLVTGSVPLPHFVLHGAHARPDGGAVYNTALILDPGGGLVGTTDKVYLTSAEGPAALDLTPGRLDAVRVWPTPVGDLAVAISLDAFRPDFIAHVEAGGATVLVQPDANGVRWTDVEKEPPTGRDQPLAWLDSAWHAVTRSSTLRYGINPMVVGNLFDIPFDGQSAITARPDTAPDLRSYVMTDPRPGFLALMPWRAEGDPETLRRAGRHLEPGSGHPLENDYRTGALRADLDLPPMDTTPGPPRPHEAALQACLEGRAAPASDAVTGALRLAWPALWLGVALLGARSRDRRRGVVALVVGAVMSALTLR